MTTTTEISIPIEAVRQIVASAERLTGGFYGHDANGLLDAFKAIVEHRAESIDLVEEVLAEVDQLSFAVSDLKRKFVEAAKK